MPFDLPHPALLTLWLLWIAQAGWACLNVRKFTLRAGRFQRRRRRDLKWRESFEPNVVIIVPVKGGSPDLPHHVQAMRQQQYPTYRLQFVVESAQDHAYKLLQSCEAEPGCPMSILISGKAQSGGQKIHNQLHALAHLQSEDEVIVFADADAVPHKDWLKFLIHPLRRDVVGATTGYRWLVPRSPANLPSAFASVMNASVATLLGRPHRNHAWGGSMALKRQTMEECKLSDYWKGALSDDYQLTRCISDAGLQIDFVPPCMVCSPVHHTWRSLWEFARRQYTITRIHTPLLWLIAISICMLYTMGWVSVIIAVLLGSGGWGWGFVAWGMAAILDLARASLRRRAATMLFDEDVEKQLEKTYHVERWLTPCWMAFHAAVIVTTAWTRHITWAGTRYFLRSPQDVRIVGRNT